MSPQSTSASTQSTPTEAAPGGAGPAPHTAAEFGPNEWLVDEIYQQYLRDPASVDKAWWDFFADYQPSDGSTSQTSVSSAAASALPAQAPVAPAAPAAQPAPSSAPAAAPP